MLKVNAMNADTYFDKTIGRHLDKQIEKAKKQGYKAIEIKITARMFYDERFMEWLEKRYKRYIVIAKERKSIKKHWKKIDYILIVGVGRLC